MGSDFSVNERVSGGSPKSVTTSIYYWLTMKPVALLEKKILERLGYRVTGCSGSLEAFDIFQSNPDSIDIVLTDMNMPKMTGDILAGKLLAVRPDIPIIICTGFSERMDEGASAWLGIKSFLMKPASKDELAEIVRNVLDESKGDPL